MSILEEISEWQIEARNEDQYRYFFHTSDFNKINDGRISFVIGRKGSGKTAIAERLSQPKHDSFSKKLSFRDFPFGVLYRKADSDFNRPHQYVSIWRYVIYRFICSMVVQNAALSHRVPESVAAALKIDVGDALALTMEKITSTELNASAFGFGGASGKGYENVEMSISAANNALSQFIWETIDENQYFILFDELDEDYTDILDPKKRDDYFSLIIGLFQAVEIVSSESRRYGKSAMPIVFLRDDIFEQCPSQDRNKWLDRALYLKWSPTQLENLLKFRLARAYDKDADLLQASNGWGKAFSVQETRYGNNRRKKKKTMSYLLDRTFNRPRDVVHLVRAAARQSLEMGLPRIGNAEISTSDLEHSLYMKREVQAELIPIFRENEYFFEAISILGKQLFQYNELKERLSMTFNVNGFKSPLTEAQIARLLFRFNVLGNEESGRRFFLYNSNSRTVDLESKFCVHRGLLKAMDLY